MIVPYLIIISTVLNFLSFFLASKAAPPNSNFDKRPSWGTKSNNLYEKNLKKGKRNRKITKGILACSYFLLIISLVLSLIESSNKRKAEKENNESLMTSITEAIDTSKVLLDSIKNTQREIFTVSARTVKQLTDQKDLNMATRSVLNQTKDILNLQRNTYINTRDLLYPFFPLHLIIEFEIPFKNLPLLAEYVSVLKNKRYDDNTRIPTYAEWGETPGYFDLSFYFNYAHVSDPSLNMDSLISLYFDISISDQGKKNSLLNFGIAHKKQNENNIQCGVYFREEIFVFTITYYNYQYEKSIWGNRQTNFDITSIDLLNKSISVRCPRYDFIEVKLISIFPRGGLNRPWTIEFKRHSTEHTIKKSDFRSYFHYKSED